MRISDWSSDVALPICLHCLLHLVLGSEHDSLVCVAVETIGLDVRLGLGGLGGGSHGVISSLLVRFVTVSDPLSGAAALKCRSEEHTSELQSLMRISYAVFCLNKKKRKHRTRRSSK